MAENVSNIAELHVAGIDLEYRAPTKPEHVRSELPVPVLTENTSWLELYWRTWSIAYDKLKTPDPKTGLVPYCDAAFSHNIFQWDTCFMLRFLRYSPRAFLAYGSLDNFYLKQHDDGFICREINSISGNDFWETTHNSSINPPLFADAEWSLYLAAGDTDRIERVLQPLCDYHGWLQRNRRAADGVGYWTTALGSGMDNSPRAHDGGDIDVHEHHSHVWMCMTSQMALSALRISQLAAAIGLSALSEKYLEELQVLTDYIRHTFWNEGLGFYADLRPDGSVSDILTPATCWPLLLPGEDPTRAKSIAAALTDPARLGRKHLVASLSAEHHLYDPKGNYWRGSVWPPMVCLAVRALQQSDEHDAAIQIARNHLEMIDQVYRETGTFWENYAPDTAAPGQIARPEFVGWTGCGPIAMLFEAIIGIEYDVPKRTVTWRIHRKDRHGIRNLDVGGNRVSLIFEPTRRVLEVASAEEIHLIVHHDGRVHESLVTPATSEVELP